MSADVSVLFARSDSCYFELGCDVWDLERDATKFNGDGPVIAHPPHISVATDEEKALGIFAVAQVRRCGGVLEHPWGSKLWAAAGIPRPSDGVDAWGGFTILVDQGWFGHKAPKPTWLYFCGIGREKLLHAPATVTRARGRTLELPVKEREETPIELAKWLLLHAAIADRPNGPVTSCRPSFVTSGQCGAVTRAKARRNSYLDISGMMVG
jgi:hypothetical protein